VLRVASDYKVSLWGLDKGSEEYTAALADCHSRAAERVLRLCREQAGVYIKAGQLLASLRPVLPQQFTDTLSQLCDDAPHSPLHDVRRVFREEMGVDMEEMFHHVDLEPIGCASLAQVHKAWLKQDDGSEGQMVALKVQHAWMSKHTQSDTLVMEAAAALLEAIFPGIDLKWLIPVFQRNLQSELNFMSEAHNMRRCADNFQDSLGIRVPELIPRFTSKRVLTMEFIQGTKVDDVESLRAQGFDPALVGREVTKIFGEMVFCHGFVHCDPHPGNMLVTPRRSAGAAWQRGRGAGAREFDVVVLDHGLYREISPAMRRGYCEMYVLRNVCSVMLHRGKQGTGGDSFRACEGESEEGGGQAVAQGEAGRQRGRRTRHAHVKRLRAYVCWRAGAQVGGHDSAGCGGAPTRGRRDGCGTVCQTLPAHLHHASH